MVRGACGWLLVLGAAACLPTIGTAVDFTLAEKGKPKCEIVLPPASSEVTQHSASRLQSAIAEASGVTLPVRSESEPAPADTCRILLGTLAENRTTAGFLRDKRLVVSLAEREQEEYKQVLVPENLGPEGFVILPGEYQGHSTLALTGGTPVAALYAVETLVDRVFVQGERVLAGPLVSEVTPVVNTPAFSVRSIATNLGGPDWVAGGQWEQEWASQGAGYDWRGFVDWMASHKLNNLDAWIFNLAFGIAYDSSRFPEVVNRLHPNVKHEFMKDLIDYAHSREIKVFVMIDFPDNWTAVVKAHPELAGKNFDPKDIPGGKEWEEYQKYGEARLNQAGGQRFRTRFSWVCMSEPKTLQFWRDYIDDLLAHYPALDGIGLQVSETARNRCNCEQCTRNPLAQLEHYFAEMVDVGRRKNPKLKFWIYNSWGTRDIEAHQARYPNFVGIDWSMMLGPLYYKQYVPRGNWYLVHTMGQRFSEFTYKYAAMALNEHGQEGMQIRAAAYKTQENSFQAFEEFAWNPRLGIDQFADLFVKKVYHHAEPQVSDLYSAWMKLLGYRALTGQAGGGPGGPPPFGPGGLAPPGAGGPPGAARGPAGPGGPSAGGVYYENPNRDADLARADEAKAAVVRLIGQVQDRSELVSAIRTAFERLNSSPGTGRGSVRPPDRK